MEDTQTVFRFPVEGKPNLVIGYEVSSWNGTKTYLGFVEDGGPGIVCWRSGMFFAADDAEPPTRKEKESTANFEERVRRADEARAKVNTYEWIWPAALLETALEFALRQAVLNQSRDVEHQAELHLLELQAVQDEADYQVYLAWGRGQSVARRRGINLN